MRILITGGNGYVGRVLCRQAYTDHDVLVADTLRFGFSRFSDAERDRFRMAHVDITDSGAVTRMIDEFRPEAIVHLAAVHFIPDCEQTPDLAVSTNVSGTVNLLHACPPGCRFVYASSGAVYRPEPTPHREAGSPIDPQDVYGFTKWHGEQYLRYLSERREFPAVTVRLFNVIGPGETNPHVLPEIVAQLKCGRRVLRLGNLEPRRDYIDVADAAAGFLAAATRGSVDPGQPVTVNLGTQKEHSVRELLDRLREVSGTDFSIEVDPARVRKVDRPNLAADISEIRRRFDWTPQENIDSTLRRTWEDPELLPALLDKYRAPA